VWLKERRERGTKVKGVINLENFNLGWSWSGLFMLRFLFPFRCWLGICDCLLSHIQSGGSRLLGICTFLQFA